MPYVCILMPYQFCQFYQFYQSLIIIKQQRQMNQNIFLDNSYSMPQRNQIQSRLQQFKLQIRKTQVEKRINTLRQQLLHSLCEDYPTLRTINLEENIKQLSKIDQRNIIPQIVELDKIIKNLHQYSISDKSDHMYLLFNDLIMQKLLSIVRWQNVTLFQAHSRLYIKIVCILSKYTDYSTSVPNYFLQTMGEILKKLLLIPNYYEDRKSFGGFSHSQIKHLIIVILSCLKNLGLERPQFYNFFLDNRTGFIQIALCESEKILKFWRQHLFTSNDYEIVIMIELIKVFSRILSFEIQDQELMKTVFSFYFKIVESILGILAFVQSKIDLVQIEIAQTLRLFLITHLSKSPKIIIIHNYTSVFSCYKKASQRLLSLSYQIHHFNERLDIQGQVRKTLGGLRNQSEEVQTVLYKWLKVLELIFGLNIPNDQNEEIENLYYDKYTQWIEEYIIPMTLRFFKVSEMPSQRILQLHTAIIADLCLQQDFCAMIIDELPIISRIFYNCRSQVVKIIAKKNSLKCLANIIRISLDGPSYIRENVLEIMQKNKIVQIFAAHMGEYVDSSVNQSLLIGLKILLQNQPCEQKRDNLVWMQFGRCGGALKLQKLLQNEKSKQDSAVARLADLILSEFEEIDF